MTLQIGLIFNRDSEVFLKNFPELANKAQPDFCFTMVDAGDTHPDRNQQHALEAVTGYEYVDGQKRAAGLRPNDLLILFTNKALQSTPDGLSNLFIAGSTLRENPPRVAIVSTAFIRRHILPLDPTYMLQRHGFFHLVVCCLVSSLFELQPHSDRGCVLDFNAYTPDFHRKVSAGYSFCASCLPLVENHPLGKSLLALCEVLKLLATDNPLDRSHRKKAKPKVFLCYAGPDRDQVENLYCHLQRDGFAPWMDKLDLIPGQDWRHEIRCSIESCDYFVACLSNAFRQRTYGHREIKLALEVLDSMPEGRIFLIPAKLEQCPVEQRLADRQWVDLFTDDGYAKLLKALCWRDEDRSGTPG